MQEQNRFKNTQNNINESEPFIIIFYKIIH